MMIKSGHHQSKRLAASIEAVKRIRGDQIASAIFGTLTAGVIEDISPVAVSSELVVLDDGRLSIPDAEGVKYVDGSPKLTLYVPKLVGMENIPSRHARRVQGPVGGR